MIHCVGGGNLSFAIYKYFGDIVKIYSSHASDKYISYQIETLKDQIKDGDIVIYNRMSSLRTYYVEENTNKDLNDLKICLSLCQHFNVKFIFISSISSMSSDTCYGRTKKIMENMVRSTSSYYIIRPSVIRYYENTRVDDTSTLENLSLNAASTLTTRLSKKSAEENGTFPLPIYKLLFLLEEIISNNTSAHEYNVQGTHYFSRLDTLELYGAEIEFGSSSASTVLYENPYIIQKKAICLILAGGLGERLGLPKQFYKFNNKELVSITYNNCYKHVDFTYVALNEMYKDYNLSDIPKECILYIKSTQSRADTIRESIEQIHCNDEDMIWITSANRPQVDIKLINKCFSTKNDVIIGRCCMDSSTYITNENGDLIPREKLYQNCINIYKYGFLKDIVKNVKLSEFSYILQHHKDKISFVDSVGSVRPFKITYRNDILTIRSFYPKNMSLLKELEL